MVLCMGNSFFLKNYVASLYLAAALKHIHGHSPGLDLLHLEIKCIVQWTTPINLWLAA